jgi:hypothetical protein
MFHLMKTKKKMLHNCQWDHTTEVYINVDSTLHDMGKWFVQSLHYMVGEIPFIYLVMYN